MIELHPTRCACGDCRNRRLISSWELSADGDPVDEALEFGSTLRRPEPGGEDGQRLLSAEPR